VDAGEVGEPQHMVTYRIMYATPVKNFTELQCQETTFELSLSKCSATAFRTSERTKKVKIKKNPTLLKRPEEFHEKTKTKNLSTIWTAFPIKSIYIYVTIAFSFANAHEFPKFVSKCSLR
jgi:hypothetical protein